MRLLRINDDDSVSLVEFVSKRDIPPYAILSHTWGADSDEVTFKDMVKGRGHNKPGYTKIRFCANQAAQDGLQFIWIDTCCEFSSVLLIERLRKEVSRSEGISCA